MENRLPSVCIFGAGAIGLSLAWHLSRSARVKVISKHNTSGLLQVELKTNSEDSGESRQLSVVSLDDPICYDSFGFYFICVKAQDQRQILSDLKPKLKTTDCVVLLSNGINMFLDAADLLGPETSIIRGLVFYGALKEKETEILQAGKPTLLLASRDIDRSDKLRVGSIFTASGMTVSYEENIARAEWKKAITSLVVNTLCTLNRCENGRLSKDLDLKRQATMLLSEIDQVIRRDGFQLQEVTPDIFFASIEQHASNINSTLLDYRRGKQTELPFTLGRFLSLADQYGVPVPLMTELAFRLEGMSKER